MHVHLPEILTWACLSEHNIIFNLRQVPGRDYLVIDNHLPDKITWNVIPGDSSLFNLEIITYTLDQVNTSGNYTR